MMSVWIAGAAYFAIVFAAGFVCGVGRELVVTPALGSTLATLLEVPVMLTVCYLAAREVTRRIDRATRTRLIMGLVAFALLMVAELAFASLIRGWSINTWLTHFASPDGAIALLMFVLFALMPLVAGRTR